MGAPGGWLPPGKSCAIAFSVDDVHPARARDGFDAGGDGVEGALGWVIRLTQRHEQLRTTLCVTADWRARVPYPTKRLLAAIPGISSRAFLSQRWPEGRMRLDRHPEFVAFLKSIPRADFVPHGLHHIQRGRNGPAEFEKASYKDCRAALAKIEEIFARAGLPAAAGHSPPGWAAPEPLRRALKNRGLRFVASARDVKTEIHPQARTAMSGMLGQPLIFPGITPEGLVHIPANFQATSTVDRALAILEAGGLLSIKAHVIKRTGRYVALDGLDEPYFDFLDQVLQACSDRFGSAIWWPSFGEIAANMETAVAGDRRAGRA
jgi:hypothetical protein